MQGEDRCMDIEEIIVDWSYIYDFLMKYNPKCSKKDFVEIMEEMKENIIFGSQEELELAREDYEKTSGALV